MNKQYFEQNLPQEFLCEICAQVCKFAKKNMETGFIFCHECCYEYDTDIIDLFSIALGLIYYKQSINKNAYNIIKLNLNEWRDSMSKVQLLKLQQLFNSQLTHIDEKDQNYKIICKSAHCQKQLNLSEVRYHFKKCEFQLNSCHFCEHWQGIKGDYQIHKQMCYKDCDKVDYKIQKLNSGLKTQEIQKRIIQQRQIQVQNKLLLLISQNTICKQCTHIVQISPFVGIPLYIYSNIDIQCQCCKIYYPVLNFQNHSIKCELKIDLENFNFSWNSYIDQIQFQNQGQQQQMNFQLQASKFTEDQISQFQLGQLLCICDQQLNLLNLKNHFYECSSVIVFCDLCQWKGKRIEYKFHKQICLKDQIKHCTNEENLLSITQNQLDMQLQIQRVEINQLNKILGSLQDTSIFFLGVILTHIMNINNEFRSKIYIKNHNQNQKTLLLQLPINSQSFINMLDYTIINFVLQIQFIRDLTSKFNKSVPKALIIPKLYFNVYQASFKLLNDVIVKVTIDANVPSTQPFDVLSYKVIYYVTFKTYESTNYSCQSDLHRGLILNIFIRQKWRIQSRIRYQCSTFDLLIQLHKLQQKIKMVRLLQMKISKYSIINKTIWRYSGCRITLVNCFQIIINIVGKREEIPVSLKYKNFSLIKLFKDGRQQQYLQMLLRLFNGTASNQFLINNPTIQKSFYDNFIC
ncbi:hypothetical protein pb186bvf_003116 [Paramecium bursaria]